MAQLQDMRANVALMLGRSDQDTNILNAIRKAQEFYEGKQWWFLEGRLSFTCSTGASQYTISASVVSIMTVTATVNGNTYEVDPISEQSRLASWVTGLTGTPSFYSVFGHFYIPYPAPNTTYTTEIACVKRQATLSASTDTNQFSIHCPALLEARAAWWMAQHVLYDTMAAQMFKGLEQEEVMRIERRMDERLNFGTSPSEW